MFNRRSFLQIIGLSVASNTAVKGSNNELNQEESIIKGSVNLEIEDDYGRLCELENILRDKIVKLNIACIHISHKDWWWFEGKCAVRVYETPEGMKIEEGYDYSHDVHYAFRLEGVSILNSYDVCEGHYVLILKKEK